MPLSAGRPDKPGAGGLVCLEEVEEQARHLLATRGRRMGAIVLEIGTKPGQAIAPWNQPIGPKIRSPRQPCAIAVAVDMLINQPFDRETALESVQAQD